jgi:hypothetical protein
MLSDEELAEFLALLTAFMTDVGLSMASTSLLFGVSPSSLSRWYSSGEGTRRGAARWVANPIRKRVMVLNEVNKNTQLYSRLTGETQAGKVDALRAALQDTASWA